MDIFTRDHLRSLMEQHKGPCVSLFMPTHRAGVENQEDSLRLKNLLKKAETQLAKHTPLRPTEASELLQPAYALLEQDQFWRNQGNGLAVFLAKGLCEHFRLPVAFKESQIVGPHFHTKPLMELFNNEGFFFVLALSQNEIRLFKGSAHTIREVELDWFDTDIASALKLDEPEKHLQFHTRTVQSAGGGERSAIFYSQGSDETYKTDIKQFLNEVEKNVATYIGHETAPLILAGVEFLLPIYREVNTYPHLMDDGILGNPKLLNPDEFHARAMEIMEPYYRQQREKAAWEFHNLKGTGLASGKLEEIVPAACDGRIQYLFVSLDKEIWGNFDEATHQVRYARAHRTDNVDLLDFAASQTFLHRGDVYAVHPAQMPQGVSAAAAVFRY